MARQLKRGIMLGQMLVLAVAMTLVVPADNRVNAAAADIFVADLDAGGPPQNGPGKIIRLSDSGLETASFAATDFVEPSGLALAANGDLLVADAEAFGTLGGVIRMNPVTGAKIRDYRGGNFVEPSGVVVLADGSILVVDQDAFPGGCDDPEGKTGCGGIIKVHPDTGVQTRFDNTGTAFWNPTALAVASNGDVLVADLDAPGPGATGPGRIFRLNSAGSLLATYVIAGSSEPSGIAVDPSGDIFVADANADGPGRVYRLNSAGQQIRAPYSGGQMDEPTGITIAWNGDLLVADQDAGGPFESGPGGVIRLNRDTAAQTTYFSGSFVNPAAVTVEPGTPPNPPPPPPPAASKCQNVQVTLSGTNNKETLKGSPQIDVISSLGGNDTIKALEGNDRVCAGSGKDKVSGGAGKDRLLGEAGNDKLLGGPGADRLVGGKGKDTCIGGPGTDKYVGCEIKVDTP